MILNKFFSIIDKKDKKKFNFILFCVFVTLIFELFSIGLMFPLLLFVIETNILIDYPNVKNYALKFNINTREQLILFSLLLIALVYLSKILFNLFVVVIQYGFAYSVQEKISNKLFVHYLMMPFKFHINKNSAFLIRNITEEVNLFIVSCVIPTMTIISEGIVIVGIILFLIYLEPQGALIVSIILSFSIFLLTYVSRKKTNYWAEVRQENTGVRLKILQQSLGIIDELKIFGRETYFIDKFKVSMRKLVESFKFQHIFLDIPRLALELVAVITFLFLILYLFLTRENATEIIPTIGIFAAAAFRILPTTNRFLASLQRIKYAKPVTEFLHKEFSEINKLENFNNKNFKDKIQFKKYNIK